MPGPLGLRIFEACGANVDDLSEERSRPAKIRCRGHRLRSLARTLLPPSVRGGLARSVTPGKHRPGSLAAHDADERTPGTYLNAFLLG